MNPTLVMRFQDLQVMYDTKKLDQVPFWNLVQRRKIRKDIERVRSIQVDVYTKFLRKEAKLGV